MAFKEFLIEYGDSETLAFIDTGRVKTLIKDDTTGKGILIMRDERPCGFLGTKRKNYRVWLAESYESAKSKLEEDDDRYLKKRKKGNTEPFAEFEPKGEETK